MPPSEIDIEQIKDRLKDRDYFETVVFPMQISKILAQLFLVFSITLAVLFLTPLLWAFLNNALNAPNAYETIFNAKMGGGMAFFLFLLASICFTIAKLNRNKIYAKAHQAYLKNPNIYTLTAVLRRKDVALYAYARDPNQQKAIEALLTSALIPSAACYKAAYALIKSEHMKHRQLKMDSLKKKIIKEAPALKAYAFSLNSTTLPEEKGHQIYCLFLETGLLAAHEHYLRLAL